MGKTTHSSDEPIFNNGENDANILKNQSNGFS